MAILWWMKPTSRAKATYADIEKLPENVVGELIDGELFVSPRPALLHASVETALSYELLRADDRRGGGRGGWCILIEPELHLGKDVLVPDLAGWRAHRAPNVRTEVHAKTVPDWVCEIVSPATARLDRTRKLSRYAKAGVRNAWIVDPPTKSVDVLRLVGKRWTIVDSATHDDRKVIEPFEEIEIDLSRVWPADVPSVHSRPPTYGARVVPIRRGRKPAT